MIQYDICPEGAHTQCGALVAITNLQEFEPSSGLRERQRSAAKDMEKAKWWKDNSQWVKSGIDMVDKGANYVMGAQLAASVASAATGVGAPEGAVGAGAEVLEKEGEDLTVGASEKVVGKVLEESVEEGAEAAAEEGLMSEGLEAQEKLVEDAAVEEAEVQIPQVVKAVRDAGEVYQFFKFFEAFKTFGETLIKSWEAFSEIFETLRNSKYLEEVRTSFERVMVDDNIRKELFKDLSDMAQSKVTNLLKFSGIDLPWQLDAAEDVAGGEAAEIAQLKDVGPVQKVTTFAGKVWDFVEAPMRVGIGAHKVSEEAVDTSKAVEDYLHQHHRRLQQKSRKICGMVFVWFGDVCSGNVPGFVLRLMQKQSGRSSRSFIPAHFKASFAMDPDACASAMSIIDQPSLIAGVAVPANFSGGPPHSVCAGAWPDQLEGGVQR